MRRDNLATVVAVCAAVLLVGFGAGTAMGAVLASETFDNDFKITGSGSMAATGGQYVVPGGTSNYELPGPGAGAPFTVSADIGKDPGSAGSFNVGMKVGDNNVVFHPGYTPIPGALRVEGPGGFGNRSVGFVPAEGVLHTLTVTGDGAGNFTLRLQDGTGLNPDYVDNWSNAGNPVDFIGVRRSGGTSVAGLYDNLSVPPAPVETFSNAFSAQLTGRIQAAGGVLRMQGSGLDTLTYPGHTGDLLVSGQIGSNPGSGNTNVGIRIGANNIVFHPGYTGGALRVEGPNGFWNQNMGFNPPGGGVLHRMEVAVNQSTGDFLIAVVNPNNASQVYTARFTNPGYSPGTDPIGFKYNSGTGGDEGRFDNLQIQSPQGAALWTNTIAASNPLHWFQLEETGALLAINSGSSGHHGIYQNGADQGQGQTGLVGGAVQFDGVNDQILLGLPNLSGPWTAEFLVEKTAVEQAGSLTRGGSYALRLDQWNNTGQVGFTQFGLADFLFTPAVSVPLGDPTHLVYVADPATGIAAYINGHLIGTNPNYIPLPLSTIGASDAFNGILDEAVFYDRALGRREILFHAGAAGFVIPEPATLVIWSLLAALGIGALWRRSRK